MFKKILLGILSVLLVLSMTACVGGVSESLSKLTLPGEDADSSASSSVAAAPKPEEMQDTQVEDNLLGLCKLLEGSYAVAGEKTQMSYEVIGAQDGYKYRFTYNGKTVQVEVYAFDLENPSDLATKVLTEIQENGYFVMLDKQVQATISDNGKYVMVYSDAGTDEKSTTQKARVLELFKKFKSTTHA